ncbi:MAG: cob(I)yrinic acid a,c-diamide adenosyltransferase [Fimbriimonadaceae bacterium]
MKIYTKTGDSGKTGLVGGSRVSKASQRIEAIGAVDEANAAFGAVRGGPTEVCDMVRWVQSRLFDVGAELASPPSGRTKYELITNEHLAALEHSIDAMVSRLPLLEQFILPGGSEPAISLHQARTAVRRAERAVASLSISGNDAVRGDLLAFLNRLSDWAFTAARFTNMELGVPEVPWVREGNT